MCFASLTSLEALCVGDSFQTVLIQLPLSPAPKWPVFLTAAVKHISAKQDAVCIGNKMKLLP